MSESNDPVPSAESTNTPTELEPSGETKNPIVFLLIAFGLLIVLVAVSQLTSQ